MTWLYKRNFLTWFTGNLTSSSFTVSLWCHEHTLTLTKHEMFCISFQLWLNLYVKTNVRGRVQQVPNMCKYFCYIHVDLINTVTCGDIAFFQTMFIMSNTIIGIT